MRSGKHITTTTLVALSFWAATCLSAAEMKVFDWNGPASESNRGFPHDQPPLQNGDWETPINYAEGTFHIRIEIRSQPVPQSMKLQFCIWQEKDGNKFELETCTKQQLIVGSEGATLIHSQAIADMWKKGGKPIEWHRARHRVGVAIKTQDGTPVSDYQGWNWNGEDPKAWYPLDFRYTVVVVSKDSEFSGWENYLEKGSEEPTDPSDPEPEPVDPEPEPVPGPEPERGFGVLSNGGFEKGMESWKFYTNGSGSALATSPGYDGSSKCVSVAIDSLGSNIQLNQSGLELAAYQDYRLTFDAYSSTGSDLRVSLAKPDSPYTVYGLNRVTVELSSSWQSHSIDFSTMNFNSKVADGRLFFWFANDARPGDVYYIDNVRLVRAAEMSLPLAPSNLMVR
ncbi:carbohydrate binding domain-containing protein [Pelagicoccus sp. NFK12]|uniref:Carbohydrate binding domain-containing protein n=1 Tax=Pelagicoccus enzymogenes TaxID=2773457 RepID=A0A927IGS7_9BACT|nr:carbohydrate binding domain-containing protein [Pelagicoccus enzymogenes]MBD5778993.1 carbohydrate binding domain-containing protein [Pelagicoccus enzymogenes]